MNFLKNKNAQMDNYLAVVLFLFIFGIFNIIAYTVWLYFVDALNSTGFVTGPIGASIAAWTNGFRSLDYVCVLVLVILIVGTAMLSYKIATNAVAFILTIFLGIFWGFVSYFFNYIFIQIVSQNIFSTALGYFPRTMVICTNLHWVMLLEIVVGSIFLYAKREKGQYMS